MFSNPGLSGWTNTQDHWRYVKVILTKGNGSNMWQWHLCPFPRFLLYCTCIISQSTSATADSAAAEHHQHSKAYAACSHLQLGCEVWIPQKTGEKLKLGFEL